MKRIQLLLLTFVSLTSVQVFGQIGGGVFSGPHGIGSSGSITNIIDNTDLAVATLYTNTSSTNLTVRFSVQISTGGAGEFDIDQKNDGVFETVIPISLPASADGPVMQYAAEVNPGGVYKILQNSGTLTIISGSCQRVYSSGVGIGGGGSSVTVPSTSNFLTAPSGTLTDSGISPSSVVTVSNKTFDAYQQGYSVQLTTNGNGVANLPYHGTTINEAQLFRSYQKMDPRTNPNGPFKTLATGDSMMTSSQGPYPYTAKSVLDKYMEFGGNLGDFSSGSINVSSGVIVSGDDTNWYSQYYILPPGASVTNAYWNGSSYLPLTNADTICVGAIQQTGDSANLGIYRMNTWNGPLTLVGTLDCSGAYNFIGTNIASFGTYYVVVKNNDASLTNRLLWSGPLINTRHAYQYFNFPYGGKKSVTGWNQVNDVIFTNAIQFLKPSMVLEQNRNNLPDELTNSLAPFIGKWQNALGTNADIVCIGTTPNGTNDVPTQSKLINAMMRNICIASNIAYVDVGNQVQTNTLASLGQYIDNTHLQPTDYKVAGMVWNEIFQQFNGINFDDTYYFRGTRNDGRRAAQQSFTANSYRKLRAYYPLCEGAGTTVWDMSGLNNTATASTNDWTTGLLSSALKADSMLTCPTFSAETRLSERLYGFTACWWVKTTNTIDGSHTYDMAVAYSSGTNGDWKMSIYPIGWQLVAVVVGDATVYSGTISLGTWLNDGLWHHLAFTYDNKNITVCVDGQMAGTVAAGGQITANYPLVFNSNISSPKNGAICEARFYSPPLTTNELSYLYQQGLHAWGNTTNLPSNGDALRYDATTKRGYWGP